MSESVVEVMMELRLLRVIERHDILKLEIALDDCFESAAALTNAMVN